MPPKMTIFRQPGSKISSLLILLIFLSFIHMTAWPQGREEKVLTIGWAELDVSDLEASHRHIALLLPALLQRALDFVGERYHIPSSVLDAGIIELEAARAKVAKAQANLDRINIQVDIESQRYSELVRAERELNSALRELEKIESLEGSLSPDFGIPGIYRLKNWSAQRSLIEFSVDAAWTCKKNGLDILVFGKCSDAHSYLSVQLYLYIADSMDTFTIPLAYSAYDQMEELVQELSRPLATAIMGREYSRLVNRLEPLNAELYVNNKKWDFNTGIFYEKTSLELNAIASGYISTSRTIDIIPGQDAIIDFKLVEKAGSSFIVETEPEGASLFVDSVYMGVTPFLLDSSDYNRVFRLEMEGMESNTSIVRAGVSLFPPVSLLPDEGKGFGGRFEKNKDAFYTSLGFFIISLPVSVLSYGVFKSWYNDLDELARIDGSLFSEEQVQSMLDKYYTAQTIFWISAVISGSLAVNSIIHLVKYINTRGF